MVESDSSADKGFATYLGRVLSPAAHVVIGRPTPLRGDFAQGFEVDLEAELGCLLGGVENSDMGLGSRVGLQHDPEAVLDPTRIALDQRRFVIGYPLIPGSRQLVVHFPADRGFGGQDGAKGHLVVKAEIDGALDGSAADERGCTDKNLGVCRPHALGRLRAPPDRVVDGWARRLVLHGLQACCPDGVGVQEKGDRIPDSVVKVSALADLQSIGGRWLVERAPESPVQHVLGVEGANVILLLLEG